MFGVGVIIDVVLDFIESRYARPIFDVATALIAALLVFELGVFLPFELSVIICVVLAAVGLGWTVMTAVRFKRLIIAD
jgi:uncharacterized membrane protein